MKRCVEKKGRLRKGVISGQSNTLKKPELTLSKRSSLLFQCEVTAADIRIMIL